MEKMRGRRPYKKCLSLVIKSYETLVDGLNIEDTVNELASLKKRLNDEEKAVIDKLSKSLTATSIVEIDEASPGNELNFKL